MNDIEIIDLDKKEEVKYNKPSILEIYGENLSKKEYVTNPAIGRDKEIEQTIEILLTPSLRDRLSARAPLGTPSSPVLCSSASAA